MSTFTRCSQCNRVIWLDQANQNGGTCGAECPQGRAVDEGSPRVPRRQQVAVPAPATPPMEILLPVEPVEPAESPETGEEATLAGDESAMVPEVEVEPEAAPQPRAGAPGANRMQARGGSR